MLLLESGENLNLNPNFLILICKEREMWEEEKRRGDLHDKHMHIV